MTLFLLRTYVRGDIYAILFGYQKGGAINDTSLFVVIKKVEKAASNNEDNDESNDAEEYAKDNKLSFLTRAGQLQIR
jgi:hypothetical protein